MSKRKTAPKKAEENREQEEEKVVAAPASTAVENEDEKKKKAKSNFWIRTASTFTLLFMFIGIVYLGHWACFGVVVFCQIAMFRELENVRGRGSLTGVRLISRISNWSFFVAFAWGVTGRVLVITFGEQFLQLGLVGTLMVKYHLFITFGMYCIAFVSFVLSLQSGHYKEQFKLFAWTHMILLVVMLQVNLWEHTLFKGLFWFVLPALLVAANDVYAYCFGRMFGKHRLIALSPNKTWEGFFGGMFSTFIAGFFLSRLLSNYSWLICPKTDLFTWDVTCVPDPVFEFDLYTVPSWFFGGFSFYARPVQFHTLVFVLFASFVAPFGGFFASGLKRAFGIKDFDNVIPGHGGITDRMDCQVLMGTFVNLYYMTFIAKTSVPRIMDKIIELDSQDQLEILNRLAAMHNMTLSP